MFNWAVGKITCFPIQRRRKLRNDQAPETSYSVEEEESSSSSDDTFVSTLTRKHDVFLSFAGKDTRLKFTDHLYDALIRAGINAFRDNEEIERGEVVSQRLHQAIKDSLCALVVVSESYADSTWCLDELQFILECRSKLGQQVFPIFYDIDPSDVRHQRQKFGHALAKHEERFRENKGKVQRWRKSLHEISQIAGWDSRGWHEADLIKDIVGKILNFTYSKLPSYDQNLVGIESRVADMMSYLEIQSDEVHFVGIWGMGGVGKTTLARVVFEKISNQFEECCFLPDVRETSKRKGLVPLQKKLVPHGMLHITDVYEGNKSLQKIFCNKKVLLVLDDVDHINQVQNLAQRQWFGKGSRVIITTRNSHLLTASKVKIIYKMENMKEDESLQLFSNKAFGKNHPENDYLELSHSVVKYSGGLPLALIVLGSFLYGRSKGEWMDTIDRLKQILDNDIYQVLKISYDGLNDEEKTIFLDIACFFRGSQKTSVTQILKNCDLHAKIGIEVLIQKALLVETDNHILEMHDLLEELGKYIVRQESPYDVGKRSRLWEFEDIKEVLENNMGSEAIQAVVLPSHYYEAFIKIEVHPQAFSNMSNIRLLLNKMRSDSLIIPREVKLSRSLKVVRWKSFPLENLPLPLDKVVDIWMIESKIKQLWSGIQFLQKLKFIGLCNCDDFTETPDFSGIPNLEHLHLKSCNSLVKVDPSLGQLRKLTVVCLTQCRNLEILPRKLETNSLVKLTIHMCQKVSVLPEFGEGMKKLSCLRLFYTAITTLPESLGSLTGLKEFVFHDSKFLIDNMLKHHITLLISGLNVTSLTELCLSCCGLNDESIPDDGFGCLSSLIVLDVSGNDFVNLPTRCFSRLFRLLFLSLERCRKLRSLPRLPPRLVRLNAAHCDSVEPLSSDRELWNLVASTVHQYRGQIKYAISNVESDFSSLELEYIEPKECHPLRDFLAITSGHQIPSWFPTKKHYNFGVDEFVIKVDIPPHLIHSEWSGIVVCLSMWGFGSVEIAWSSKAPEDDDFVSNKWAHSIDFNKDCKLLTMVLELNEKTCWQHLTPLNNSLHIKLITKIGSFDESDIMGYGWRLIHKEEMKGWCDLNDLNQLALPQLASPHEVNLLKGQVESFIAKVSNESSFLLDDVLDAWF